MDDTAEDQAPTEHTPPAIQSIQAKRRRRLFNVLIAATVWTLAVVAFLLFFRKTVETRFSAPIEIETAAAIVLGVSAILLASVQLALEVPVRQWPVEYRRSRRLLDQERAADKELDSKRAERIALANASLRLMNPDESYRSYQNERVAREQRENDKWKYDNYGYISRISVERMQAEIEQQGSRANTNLTIALVVAFFGVVILAWLAYDVSSFMASPPANSENQLLFYAGAFFAKLALSLSANVFAFFFLATYRRNLSEIRYFHNELTNLESKLLATYMAAHNGADASFRDALSSLAKTERNFVLKKGETTADLSAKGLDKEETKDAMTSLAAIANTLESIVNKSRNNTPSEPNS